MKKSKITRFFLKGTLVSKITEILLLSCVVYIVFVAFSFTQGFAAASLTFKRILTYATSPFSSDNSPPATTSSLGTVSLSVPTGLKTFFKPFPIAFAMLKLKTIDPLVLELSQRPLSFSLSSKSDQQTFPDVFSTLPSERGGKGVQGSFLSLEAFPTLVSLAENFDEVISTEDTSSSTIDNTVPSSSQGVSEREDSLESKTSLLSHQEDPNKDSSFASPSGNKLPLATADNTSVVQQIPMAQTPVVQHIPVVQASAVSTAAAHAPGVIQTPPAPMPGVVFHQQGSIFQPFVTSFVPSFVGLHPSGTVNHRSTKLPVNRSRARRAHPFVLAFSNSMPTPLQAQLITPPQVQLITPLSVTPSSAPLIATSGHATLTTSTGTLISPTSVTAGKKEETARLAALEAKRLEDEALRLTEVKRKAEEERFRKEEKVRLAVLAKAEEERLRKEEELRLAEVKRKADEEEKLRLAEVKRKQEEEATALRLAEEKRKEELRVEELRLAEEKRKEELRVEELRLAEVKRKADEEEKLRLAEVKRKVEEEEATALRLAEVKRKADEEEKLRLAEVKRKAEEERFRKEEKVRLAVLAKAEEERLRKEEELRLAEVKRKADEEEKLRLAEVKRKEELRVEELRLAEVKPLKDEGTKEDSIKVFRVPVNSMAADFLRDGRDPDTFEPLMGNERIEYTDDELVVSSSSSLPPVLSEEVDLSSPRRETFDTSVVEKLIGFYKHVLSAYDLWNTSEDGKLQEVVRSVHAEDRKLDELGKQRQAFYLESVRTEEGLKRDITRDHVALKKNQEERQKTLAAIKSSILDMVSPHKEWVGLLNKQIERISQKKAELLLNTKEELDDLRSLEDLLGQRMIAIHKEIREREGLLEKGRDKAQHRYDEIYSDVQSLIKDCFKEGLKHQGVTASEERIAEQATIFVTTLEKNSREEVKGILSNFEKAMSPSRWAAVQENFPLHIESFREASRVLEVANAAIKGDAALQKLKKNFAVVKAQLEECTQQIYTLDERSSSEKDELDRELSQTQKTLVAVAESHDAFNKWATSLEPMDEDDILDSLENAKHGLSLMRAHLESGHRSITKFDEDYKALQELWGGLQEQVDTAPTLHQRHKEHETKLAELQKNNSATLDDYDIAEDKHRFLKEGLAGVKRAKESMLKKALGIAQALDTDVRQLKRANDDFISYVRADLVTPTHAKEYSEFTQRLEQELTPQGRFSILAPQWAKYKPTQSEPLSVKWDDIVTLPSLRLPVASTTDKNEDL